MQALLVDYATTEGHTREVAEFIAERLRIRGHRVDRVDVATPAASNRKAGQRVGALRRRASNDGRRRRE